MTSWTRLAGLPGEEKQEQSSLRSGGKSRKGLQCCKNYPESCDFFGFFGYRYSGEGLCKECELKDFPLRFSGCKFCGKAIKKRFACLSCTDGFSDWLFDLFYRPDVHSPSTKLK